MIVKYGYKSFFILCFYLVLEVTFFSYTMNIEALKGSSVYFNTKFVGIVEEIPFKINVPDVTSGNVQIKKNGYSDFSVEIQFVGSEATIKAIQVPLTKIFLDFGVGLNNVLLEYEFLEKKYIITVDSLDEVELPYTVSKILLKKEGYYPKEIEFDLRPFMKEELKVDLISIDEVLICSEPLNVQVFLDNVFIGETPIKVKKEDLPKVILKKDGYIDKKFDIMPSKESPTVIAELKKGASLFIDSDPQGVAVFLNSEFLGLTPLEKIIESGDYKLYFSKTGYQAKEMNVSISKEGLNRYFVKLDKRMDNLMFINSNNYEFNIDGVNLGENITKIVLDDNKHLLRSSSKGKILEFIIYPNFWENSNVIDLNRISTVNVYSENKETVNLFDKSQKTPAFFPFNILGKSQFVNVRTLSRTYSLLIEASESYDLFIDQGFGVLFITTNVEKPLIYLDGKYLTKEEALGITLKPGIYNIEVRYMNEVKTQKVHIKEKERTYVNFSFDQRIPVNLSYSRDNLIVNSQTYMESPKLLYLKSGPNLFSDGEKSVIVFIYKPQNIDLDKLFEEE